MAVRTAPAAAKGETTSWPVGSKTWLLPPLVIALLGGWLVAQRYGFWFD